ncbi:MAG: hypothetical protein EP344_04215 [Bacteroidetes bacterium]|nr:MAG: hypothetical protein EP344_04215 [Bacteroidota bacterium]
MPTLLTTTRALQIFQLMRLGSVILTSILLAKSGLRTADIGAFEALLYVGTVAAFFWANGLLQGIPPVWAHLASQERKVFTANVFFLFAGIAAILVLLLWTGKAVVLPLLTGFRELPAFGWFCVYLFCNLATLPVEYLYLLREEPERLVLWGCFSFGLFILALAGPVFLEYGLEGGLAGLAVLGALRFLWASVLVFRRGEWVWQPALIRPYLWFSMPLVLNFMVGNLVLLFDSWLVGWYYSDASVFAVFRYGSREFPLATALATALGTAMIAQLAKAPADGLAALKEKSRRLFHLLFPLTVVLLFLTKPLFPLVFNPDFAASASLFNIYLLLTASRVLLPNAIVLSRGKSRAILLVGLLELTVKIALGFWFIHLWGLPGVAWSAVLAFFLEKIGLVWYLEKRLQVRTSDWLDRRWYGFYVLVLAMAYAVTLVFGGGG